VNVEISEGKSGWFAADIHAMSLRKRTQSPGRSLGHSEEKSQIVFEEIWETVL
jgi:hypothetical protein